MTTRITFALLALSTAAACAPEPGSFPLAAGAAATEVDLVLSPPPASVPEAATAAGHAALARVEPHSTVIWPKVDGYSDPNPIVYDQANFDRYLEICWATRRTLICGTICRQMTVGDRTVGFTTGFAYLHAGGRFHIDSLRQFLRARIARSTPEVSDAEAVKKLAEVGVPSPWVADVCASIEFIREAKASDALPELDALLSDPDENVWFAAVQALERFGPAASASVPQLIPLLETRYGQRVADTLARIGPEAVGPLTRKVNSGGIKARMHAIRALGEIGPPAATAVDALIEALHEKKDAIDHSRYISQFAAEALGHIGDRQALPPLRQMAAAKNAAVRTAAVAAIRKIEQRE